VPLVNKKGCILPIPENKVTNFCEDSAGSTVATRTFYQIDKRNNDNKDYNTTVTKSKNDWLTASRRATHYQNLNRKGGGRVGKKPIKLEFRQPLPQSLLDGQGAVELWGGVGLVVGVLGFSQCDGEGRII
jgi:hypothetical protein